MSKYMSESAEQNRLKALDRLRRDLEEKLGKEAAAKKGEPNLTAFESRRISTQCLIPPPGSTDHIKMWQHPVSGGTGEEEL